MTGDHIATACLRNPELLDSPGVGSHCEQSAPIAYGSVCRKRYPGQARQRTAMAKFTFSEEQELRQTSASERGRCFVWQRPGQAVPEHQAAVHCASTGRHSRHSPGQHEDSNSDWIYRHKTPASALLVCPQHYNFLVVLVRVTQNSSYEGKTM